MSKLRKNPTCPEVQQGLRTKRWAEDAPTQTLPVLRSSMVSTMALCRSAPKLCRSTLRSAEERANSRVPAVMHNASRSCRVWEMVGVVHRSLAPVAVGLSD